MRLLADESCDFAVVRALRAADHDVVAVVEIQPRADDLSIIELARRDGRIVLTEDKDFGQLVYAGLRSTGGVILIRAGTRARTSVAESVVSLLKERAEQVAGAFVVVRPGRIRIARLPESGPGSSS